MQKYIQLEGFVKSNNEAVEAVVQHLVEKYKIEKETIKKYVDGVTVNPEETYYYLDKIYAMTKTTKRKQRLVYVHVAEYCLEKLAGRADVAVSPKETTKSSLFFVFAADRIRHIVYANSKQERKKK